MELEELLIRISKMEPESLEVILNAAFERKRELYPDWDIIYLALPKEDWQERKRTLTMALNFEERFRQKSMEQQK